MVKKLQGHVAKSANAHDPDTVGRANCILNNRVEDGDAATEQRARNAGVDRIR